jgi:hypothetical protein
MEDNKKTAAQSTTEITNYSSSKIVSHLQNMEVFDERP